MIYFVCFFIATAAGALGYLVGVAFTRNAAAEMLALLYELSPTAYNRLMQAVIENEGYTVKERQARRKAQDDPKMQERKFPVEVEETGDK